MSNPRAFISFDFDHNEGQKVLFIGQSKLSKTPFNIEEPHLILKTGLQNHHYHKVSGKN